MGLITENVTIKNYIDMTQSNGNSDKTTKIRTLTAKALINTSAHLLSLPPKMIQQLGLCTTQTLDVLTLSGAGKRKLYGGALIQIQDRQIQMEIMENPIDNEIVVGSYVLEIMDLYADPYTHTLKPNPLRKGKWFLSCI